MGRGRVSLGRAISLAGFAARYLGRMREGRRRVLAHLASGNRETVPPPSFVQLRVTNLCNFRCRMCGQWGDTGTFREDGTGQALASDGEEERARVRDLVGAKRQLALADWTCLLDEVAPGDPVITLFGGEPLLYPDLVPLVREVKVRGLVCTLITNGARLEEAADGLVEAGIDSIAVSIDGPPAVHDGIRRHPGSFKRAAEGVRAVARRRREAGAAAPMLLAILPVTELNVGTIPEALEALRELPFDAVNVGLRWFVGSRTGAEYEQVMSRDLGASGSSWKGFEFDGPAFAASRGPELTVVSRFLAGLRRRRILDSALGRPWVSFVPDIPASGLARYFADPKETFGHDLCPVAWYFAQVEPDGTVCFCGDFPDYVLGNVNQSSFDEIWRGERARTFREKLAKEPLPVCSRCCGSWVYGRWGRPSPLAPVGRRRS